MFIKVFVTLIFCLIPISICTKTKIKLISLEKCKLPDSRRDMNNKIEYSVTARRISREKTVINSNFTIPSRGGPVLFTFRVYQMKQGSNKDLIFKLEKIGCQNPVTFQLIRVIGLNLDKECFVLPGYIETSDINLDDFKWIFTKAMIGPGKYSYDLEFSTQNGVCVCIAFTCDISEIK